MSPPTILTEPPLQAGDQFDAQAFLSRWQQMPELRRAELIDRRVRLLSSPVTTRHGRPAGVLMQWAGYYAGITPGLTLLPDTTTILDDRNVVQPDVQLDLPASLGGSTTEDDNHHVVGPPELVAEAAFASASTDFGETFNRYEAAGVREYVLLRASEHAVDWWVNTDHGFTPIRPDEQGILHSTVFPGLCMRPAMLLAGDAGGLFRLIQHACDASDAHRALVASLADAR